MTEVKRRVIDRRMVMSYYMQIECMMCLSHSALYGLPRQKE
jgi:ribosomal protein S27E